MQRTLFALFAVLSATPLLSSQPVKPTTTLAAETANNTSAANTFTTTTNGDLAAGNVSKLPIRSLLYPGSSTLVFAHVEPWWGKSSHISIGYSSQDPAQAQRQVADMISRGIDGAVIDWYGPTSYEDAGFKTFLAQAEAQPGFAVVAEIEHGAVLWDSCYPGCTATTAVIQLSTYVAQTFFPSPAYYRINGRPVLMEFAMEVLPTAVDWNAVTAAVPGNPLFIHRNTGGFGTPDSSGSFAWMNTPTTPPPGYDGSSYLSDFYKFATQHAAAEYAWGSVFKGFDDTLASWAPPGGRHIPQNCGQTWLTSFATANQWYSAAQPLPFMQLVTWNDYEEGTELESGIDNCVSVTAFMSGSLLTWQISGGSENTIDHYTAFISPDGSNLMPIADFATGVHSVDMSAYSFDPGAYQLLVKAVGKPSIRNQMSNAVAWSIAPPPPPPGLSLIAAPPSLSLSRGNSGAYTVTLTPQGTLAGPILLACSGAPDGSTCTVTPAQIPASTSPSTVTVSISTAPAASGALRYRIALRPWTLPLGLIGAMGLLSASAPKKRRIRPKILLCLALTLALLLAGCGGVGPATTSSSASSSTSVSSSGSGSTPAPDPTPTPSPAPPSPTPLPASGTYTITVSATSGNVQASTTANLVIQ